MPLKTAVTSAQAWWTCLLWFFISVDQQRWKSLKQLKNQLKASSSDGKLRSVSSMLTARSLRKYLFSELLMTLPHGETNESTKTQPVWITCSKTVFHVFIFCLKVLFFSLFFNLIPNHSCWYMSLFSESCWGDDKQLCIQSAYLFSLAFGQVPRHIIESLSFLSLLQQLIPHCCKQAERNSKIYGHINLIKLGREHKFW